MAAPASALRVSGLASTPRKWVSGGAPTLPWGIDRAAARQRKETQRGCLSDPQTGEAAISLFVG